MTNMAVIVSFASLLCACHSDTPPETVDSEDAESVCYDSFDNDDDGAIDCADSGCSDLASCCVANASDNCCESEEQVFSMMVECVKGPLETCAPTLAVFGEPEAAVLEGGIAGSDSTLESGAYLPSPLDLKGANLRISFEAATAVGCVGGCVNYVGVGLSRAQPVTGDRVDRFPLAVVVRPGFNDASLFLFGTDVFHWPIDEAFHRFAIDIRANGGVTVSEIDSAGATVEVLVPEFMAELPDLGFATIIGWSLNLQAATPARVRSLAIERGHCDNPARTAVELDPVIPRPGSPEASALTFIEGVGRAKNAAGVEAVVIDAGDAFHLLKPDASGDYQFTRALGMPIVNTASIPGATVTTIDDPWLVADEDAARWQLYFTVRTGSNDSMIARISGLPSFADGFDLSTYVVVAEPDATFPKLEMPTVLGDRMIARAANAGLGILVRLQRDGPDHWSPAGAELADGRIHLANFDNPSAMDHDEVADPALVSDDGVLRLYFAGRRGTRWRIGLLVSVAGEFWHQPLGEEPLWELDGIGFDSLRASDPAPLIEDGMASLLYIGGDGGAVQQVGRAQSGSTRAWPAP